MRRCRVGARAEEAGFRSAIRYPNRCCGSAIIPRFWPRGVGAVGEASRLFLIELAPVSGGVVGIAAIRVGGGKVGGSTNDVWPEELGGAILELST